MSYLYKGRTVSDYVSSGGSTATGFTGFPINRATAANTNALTKVDETVGYTGSGWNHTYFSAKIQHVTTSGETTTLPSYINHFRWQAVGGGGGGGGSAGGLFFLKNNEDSIRGGSPGSPGNAGGVSDNINKVSVDSYQTGRRIYVNIGGGGTAGAAGLTQGVNRNTHPQATTGLAGSGGTSGGSTGVYVVHSNAWNLISTATSGTGGAGGYATNRYNDDDGYHFGQTHSATAPAAGSSSIYGIGNTGIGGAGGDGPFGNGSNRTLQRATSNGSAGGSGHVRIFKLHG